MSYSGYSIEEIEDAIISTLEADETLAGYVKTFERMPWDRITELGNIFKRYPAIVVAYRGGSDDNSIYSVCDHAGLFAVLCANKNARSLTAAARGLLTGEPGVYEMMGDVLSALNYSKLGLNIISCVSAGDRLVSATGSMTIFSREFEVKWRYMYGA